MKELLDKNAQEILDSAQAIAEKGDIDGLAKIHGLIRRIFCGSVVSQDSRALAEIYKATVNFCEWFRGASEPRRPEVAGLVSRWEEIGELARQLSTVWRQQCLVHELRDAERTILAQLASEEPLASGELATRCGMNTHQQIAPHLRRLEQWGFIRRRRSGRNVLVWLGAEGRRIAEEQIEPGGDRWAPPQDFANYRKQHPAGQQFAGVTDLWREASERTPAAASAAR